jgi:hypothetical protein
MQMRMLELDKEHTPSSGYQMILILPPGSKPLTFAPAPERREQVSSSIDSSVMSSSLFFERCLRNLKQPEVSPASAEQDTMRAWMPEEVMK